MKSKGGIGFWKSLHFPQTSSQLRRWSMVAQKGAQHQWRFWRSEGDRAQSQSQMGIAVTSSSSEAHSKERTRLISRDNLFREALTKNVSQKGAHGFRWRCKGFNWLLESWRSVLKWWMIFDAFVFVEQKKDQFFDGWRHWMHLSFLWTKVCGRFLRCHSLHCFSLSFSLLFGVPEKVTHFGRLDSRKGFWDNV